MKEHFYVVFYKTKLGEAVFWNTVAFTEEEAKEEFGRDYHEHMKKDLEMEDTGYYLTQLPSADVARSTKDNYRVLTDEDMKK